jgi:predicted dinucleotide-binding enzyme
VSPTNAPEIATLGVVGAGRIGRAVAALAAQAGLPVTVASARPVESLREQFASGAPGVVAGTLEQAAAADAVVLAIPLARLGTLASSAFAGVLVVDAMNYWWELDGHRPEFEDPCVTTSERVQQHVSEARVVKTINHLSAYALENLARPAGDPERIALAVAGDSAADREAVAALVDRLGFDPVIAGALAEGVRFEPATELFGADADAAEAREMLDRFWDSQRGRVLARARGRTPS